MQKNLVHVWGWYVILFRALIDLSTWQKQNSISTNSVFDKFGQLCTLACPCHADCPLGCAGCDSWVCVKNDTILIVYNMDNWEGNRHPVTLNGAGKFKKIVEITVLLIYFILLIFSRILDQFGPVSI